MKERGCEGNPFLISFIDVCDKTAYDGSKFSANLLCSIDLKSLMMR